MDYSPKCTGEIHRHVVALLKRLRISPSTCERSGSEAPPYQPATLKVLGLFEQALPTRSLLHQFAVILIVSVPLRDLYNFVVWLAQCHRCEQRSALLGSAIKGGRG
jgi:hypothetical protein